MNCRKCGEKGIRRIRAGEFQCNHCGPAPMPVGLDPHRTEYPVPVFTLEADDGLSA